MPNILNEVEQWITEKVLNLCQLLITFCSSLSSRFWDVALIDAFLSFIRWVSVGMVAASTILLLADVAEEAGKERQIEWSTVILNFFKGLGFALVAPTAGKWIFIIGSELAGGLDLSKATADLSTGAVNASLGLLFIVIVACIIFAFMSLSRFGVMLVQIISAPLYISDIVRGETAAMGSWIRQTVAIALTYLIQVILFYLGAYFMTLDELQIAPLGLACWLAMSQVSRILQKYGMSTGVTGVVSGAASVVRSGIQLAARL